MTRREVPDSATPAFGAGMGSDVLTQHDAVQPAQVCEPFASQGEDWSSEDVQETPET